MVIFELDKILTKKLKKEGYKFFTIKFHIYELKLTIDSLEHIEDALKKILKELKLKIANQYKNIIIIDRDSFNKFQERIVHNAKEKWVIEIINPKLTGDCRKYDCKMDIGRIYFDKKIDAMIYYYNETMQRDFEYDKKEICLAPKKVLYFEI